MTRRLILRKFKPPLSVISTPGNSPSNCISVRSFRKSIRNYTGFRRCTPKRRARLAPLAQMREADLTYDCASQVSDKNPSVAPPLKVSDCSQITDGAASLVLVSGKYLDRIGRDKSTLPRLLGFGHTTDYLALEKK